MQEKLLKLGMYPDRTDAVLKESNEALSRVSEAMADLAYAKQELETMGIIVEWPQNVLTIAGQRGILPVGSSDRSE